MIAARTRIAALVVVFFALTSILWGSTAAHATDGLSISGTVYLTDGETTATTGDVDVEYTLVGSPHVAADFVALNADGTWTIPGLSSGNYFIYYHYLGADGYASKYQSQEAVLTYPFADQATVLGDTDLTGATALQEVLEKTGSVTGHVSIGTSGTSATADQVTVTASVYAGQNGADAAYTTLPSVNTDASGNYTITGLVPGSNWRLLFTSNVTGTQSVYYGQVLDDDGQAFTVGGGAALTKNQTVPNLMSIAGHVYLGSTTTPAAAGAVTLQLREYNNNVLNTNVIDSTTTVAGGAYSFQGLDNRKFQVTAVAPSGYTDSTPVDYTSTQAAADFTLAAVVTTPTTYTLTGHIDVGTAGTSAKNGEIYVGLFLASDEETLLSQTTTDASGNYSFPGLAAGSYVVVASDFSHTDQHEWVYYGPTTTVGASGSVAATAVLPISVSGHVLSPTSAPLAGIQVTAIEYDTVDSVDSTRAITTTTDANGYYRFPLLSYGPFGSLSDSYVLLAHDANGQYASLVYDDTSPYYTPDYITISDDADYSTTQTADFDMELANHIAGTVSGVSAADLANHDVTIEVQVLNYATSDDGVWFSTGDIWPVAADGTYNVGDLPDDAYRLVFTYDGPKGTVSATSPEFDVSGGQTVSYSLTLPPPSGQLPTGSPIGSLDSATAGLGNVTVSGWALDPDALTAIPVALYIDGVYQGRTQAETVRTDIGTAFPGYGPDHGYQVTLVGVAAGAHTVCAYGINVGAAASNTTLGCKTFTVSVANPFGSLDSVSSSGPGSVAVSGWALDADATTPLDVHVYVDGAFNSVLSATGTRTDVGNAYPGTGSEHGYSTSLTGLAGGTHSICTYGINQGTGSNALLGCRSITVLGGSPIGSFDSATITGPGSVALSGWAIDPDAADSISVHVYVDGVYNSTVSPVTADGARPDLAAAFVGYGANHGFAATLTGLTGGKHTICVYGINELAGSNSTVGCKTITVPTGGPVGSLDTATGVTGGISMSGWVLDPDTAASTSVDVYVDNAYNESVTAAVSRTDIATAFPGYGAAHGFTTTATATPGSHTVCVYGINSASTPGSNALLRCTTVVVPTVPAG